MTNPQLKLVADVAPGFSATALDPTRQIFEHWLLMAGKSPRRCKLGPIRRTAINSALALGYEVDMLLCAVEGMAADKLLQCSANHIRDRMREIDWLMGAEARIEHWADLGEALRQQLQQQEQAQARHRQVASPPPSADDVHAAAAAKAAAIDHMRRYCADRRAGAQHG